MIFGQEVKSGPALTMPGISSTWVTPGGGGFRPLTPAQTPGLTTTPGQLMTPHTIAPFTVKSAAVPSFTMAPIVPETMVFMPLAVRAPLPQQIQIMEELTLEKPRALPPEVRRPAPQPIESTGLPMRLEEIPKDVKSQLPGLDFTALTKLKPSVPGYGYLPWIIAGLAAYFLLK